MPWSLAPAPTPQPHNMDTYTLFQFHPSLIFQVPPVCSQHSALSSCIGFESLMEERHCCFPSSSMLPQFTHFNVELNCLSLNLIHPGIFSPLYLSLSLSLSPFYHCHLWVCDRRWMFGINSWVNIGITLETAERWPYWCVPPFWALNPHALWEIWKL